MLNKEIKRPDFAKYLKIYVNSVQNSMTRLNKQYDYSEKHQHKPKKHKKRPKKENICGGTIGDLLKAKGQI